MKIFVFDNAGTLTKRYIAVKDLRSGKYCFDIGSQEIVDHTKNRVLLGIDTDSLSCLLNANPNQKIYDFIKKNKIRVSATYPFKIKNKTIIKMLKTCECTVKELQDLLRKVGKKGFNIQICTGSGFIGNLDTCEIEFLLAAGGKLFPGVKEVINELKKRNIEVYIASGDREEALKELARIIKIPISNVFGHLDPKGKEKVVKNFKKRGKVVMVGNGPNDVLALKAADVGILTLQHGEKIPNDVLDASDIVIKNIKEILKILDDIDC
ncbi:Haloacid dehalogenase domain protein hydrolase [Methanothermus fervidus DSM 2088]|uniref:Haloacid dehalogenase domain protein hydrolase n=1 Tax=Methanothermus fervidus (strain ATCC 43054 / DSM 2088 / JCM 10308 / V24 S) TaxID=523846 RepID=E3GYY5_METFV|nr:HAD-IC family P-type ATPase [Methanothermus fervidus]ADP77517.1 Haloacid dehalogenase domain protein hydrolase [Methanothermus fervidus DSM 2088]